MEAFGKDKDDYRAIGTFLVFTADDKENLSNSEYRKAPVKWMMSPSVDMSRLRSVGTQ